MGFTSETARKAGKAKKAGKGTGRKPKEIDLALAEKAAGYSPKALEFLYKTMNDIKAGMSERVRCAHIILNKSLPDMKRSSELADVDAFFFERMQGDAE